MRDDITGVEEIGKDEEVQVKKQIRIRKQKEIKLKRIKRGQEKFKIKK